MGYAKYTEDIEKIHSQNIFGTRLDFQVLPPVQYHRCPFCSFETTAKEQLENHLLKEHRDAAIFLEHDDRIVPDRVVFRVRPVYLKVRCPALPNGIEVSVTSNSRPRAEKRFKDGQLLTITPPDEEIVLLVLGIGVFKREYAISFKKQVFQARLTPYLIERVSRANTSIGSWAWPDMGRFESELMNEPGLSTDEGRHRLAIYEYYLGLRCASTVRCRRRQIPFMLLVPTHSGWALLCHMADMPTSCLVKTTERRCRRLEPRRSCHPG